MNNRMDMVSFSEIRNKMTNNCSIDCSTCPFSISNNGKDVECKEFIFNYPKEAIEIAIEWQISNNTTKTRAQVFFEKFPNAPRGVDNVPSEVCAKKCGLAYECVHRYCYDCWKELAPYEYQG